MFSKSALRHLIRFASSDVRVRFAPSPTGKLHLGGLRTALYNFLFAKSQNGTFILRIEDTDRTRLVPGAVDQLEKDLAWVGLKPDEGPSSGGDFGPYVQSERFHIYREFTDRLVSSGAAYPCFCTGKRLDLLRKDALRNRLVPKYDNRCRNLTKREIVEKTNAGISFCIRFKLVSSAPFDDLVYGRTQHEVEEIEGDPVILKADGWPTYHLANVVDDSLMGVSHVIRGVEWLPSTNKHLMMYSALGLKPPVYGHLPLLLNTDGTKLSKRQNDITVESMKSQGIFPRALLNYVIQAGGGFPKDISPNSSIQELIKSFDLSKVNKSSGKLPTDQLAEFNRFELTRKVNNEDEMVLLRSDVQKLVMERFIDKHPPEDLDLSPEHIHNILMWCAPRVSRLNDLVDKNLEFLWVTPREEQLAKANPVILEAVLEVLSKVAFQRQELVPVLKKFSDDNKIQFKELMSLLRMALSGLKQGPGVAEMLEILGKSTSLKRIDRAKNLASERRDSPRQEKLS